MEDILKTVILAIALPSAAYAQNEPLALPKEFVGTFAFENCDNYSDGGVWTFTRHSEVFVGDVAYLAPLRIVANYGDQYHLLYDSNDNQGYFLQLINNGETLRLSDFKDDTPIGARPSDNPNAFDTTDYIRCAYVPPAIKALVGESIDILETLDDTIALCSAGSKNCITSAFDAFDVAEDGELSRAELARASRFAIQFAGIQSEPIDGLDIEKLAAVTSSSFVVAPLLAQMLLVNLDYDNSQSLSLSELSSDRFSIEIDDPNALEVDEFTNLMGELMGQLPDAATALGSLMR